MRPTGSERALRRAVADLARLDQQDITEVLALLTPDRRRRVAALLSAFMGAPVTADTPAQGLEAVSPTLAARAAHDVEASRPLTETARATLRACIAEAAAQAPLRTPTSPAAPGPGLPGGRLARLMGLGR